MKITRLLLLGLIAFGVQRALTSDFLRTIITYLATSSQGQPTLEDNICLTLQTDFSAETLVQGMSGPDVRSLQKLLIEKYGYSIPFNATFDQSTVEALQDFQAQNGLAADGIVGPGTWETLISNSGCQ